MKIKDVTNAAIIRGHKVDGYERKTSYRVSIMGMENKTFTSENAAAVYASKGLSAGKTVTVTMIEEKEVTFWAPEEK